MEEVTTSKRKVFWTKTDMDGSSEDSDAYVPGVTLNQPGNWRPVTSFRMRGRRTPEVKTEIPLTRRPMEDLPFGIADEDVPDVEVVHRPRDPVRKLSFKDLRPEDKQRVAKLIKELAKTGEEKEKVFNQLHDERESFQKHILQLIEQQEQILKEKEEIQKRFFESQQLLNKYQEELLQDQENQKLAATRALRCSTWNTKPSETNGREVRTHHPQGVEPTADYTEQFGDRAERHVDEMQNGNDGKLDDAGYVQDGYGQDGYVQEGYIQAAGDGCHQTGRDRPYTAQIDREIAEQNTATNGLPRSSELIQVQPLVAYKPQRTTRYPKNPVRSRPFREPIMSSTQKSSVMDEVSLTSIHTVGSELQSVPRDGSPRSPGTRRNPPGDARGGQAKELQVRVGFFEPVVQSQDDAKLHSPFENELANSDQVFLRYYKKLTPEERRQILLEQKKALLEEQQRLKQILINQERQLCKKQQILKQLHLERKKGLERELAGSVHEDRMARLLLQRQLGHCEDRNSGPVVHDGRDPRILEHQQERDGRDPRILEHQQEHDGRDPRILVHQQERDGRDPRILGHQQERDGRDPRILEHQQAADSGRRSLRLLEEHFENGNGRDSGMPHVGNSGSKGSRSSDSQFSNREEKRLRSLEEEIRREGKALMMLEQRNLESKTSRCSENQMGNRNGKSLRLLEQIVNSDGEKASSEVEKQHLADHQAKTTRLRQNNQFPKRDGRNSIFLERERSGVFPGYRMARRDGRLVGSRPADDVSKYGKSSLLRDEFTDEEEEEEEELDLNTATYVVDKGGGSRVDGLVRRLDYSAMSDVSHSSRDPVVVRSRMSAATSPIATDRVSVGTSPVRRSPSTERVDVATSVSYRHLNRCPPRLSPRQSNLSLPVDGQDTGSPRLETNSLLENSLSLLEIVDCIQDGRLSCNGSLERVLQTSAAKENQSIREQSLANGGDEDENLEESQILEEIFFLK